PFAQRPPLVSLIGSRVWTTVAPSRPRTKHFMRPREWDEIGRRWWRGAARRPARDWKDSRDFFSEPDELKSLRRQERQTVPAGSVSGDMTLVTIQCSAFFVRARHTQNVQTPEAGCGPAPQCPGAR